MSTLNSRDAEELDLLREAFRAFVLDGRPPSVELIIMMGIDKELLVRCMDELGPLLSDLRGYKPLDDWFKSTAHVPYRTWLEEANMDGQYSCCVNVLDACMQDENERSWLPLHPQEEGRYPGEEKRYAKLMVWLTHKGEWIIWANHPTSTFRITGELAEALRVIEELTPDGISLVDPRGMLRSSVLCMWSTLRNLLAASTELKLRSAQADARVYQLTEDPRKRFGD